MPRILLFAVYLACVPLSNWLIGHMGTSCFPQGPCVVPVGFGQSAPSGVMVAGLALVLRDLLQRTSGVLWSLTAIGAGTALSFALAPPSLVTASGTAFFLSEICDLAIYTPLQRRGLIIAVLVSCTVGLAIDSAVFLWLAFGSMDHLAGQIIGKIWAVLAATAIISVSSWSSARVRTGVPLRSTSR